MAQGGEGRLRHLFAIAEQLAMPPLIVKRLSRHKRSANSHIKNQFFMRIPLFRAIR